MSKKIALSLFALAALLTVANFFVATYSRRTVYTPPTRVIKLPPNDIEAVVIYQGENTLAEFRRTNSGNWQFQAPHSGIPQATADRAAIEELLNFAARAETTPAKIELAAAGLARRDLMQIVYHAGNDNASVFLGDFSAEGQQRYFAADTARETPLVAPAALLRVFTRAPEDFRSRDLFIIRGRGLEGITLTTTAQTLNLRRTPRDGWVITQPFNWLADNEVVGGLLQALLTLRAEKVIAEIPTAVAAKITPADKVTLSLTSDAQTQTAILTVPENSPVAYAEVAGHFGVYEIPAAMVRELLNPQLGDIFRRRVLDLLGSQKVSEVRISSDVAGRLTLQKDNTQWLATVKNADAANAAVREKFPADEKTVQGLINLFSHLPLVRVLAENHDAVALTNNATTIGFYDLSGALLSEIKGEWLTDKLTPTTLATATVTPLFAAQLKDRPQVVELPLEIGMIFNQPFIAYRDRQVLNLGFAAIKEVSVQALTAKNNDAGENSATYRRVGEATFKQIAPTEKNLSETANWEILTTLRQLAQLKCEGYLSAAEVQATPSTYGLDRPLFKIMLTLTDVQEKLTLTIGSALSITTADNLPNFYGATLLIDSSPLSFVIDEKLVERIKRLLPHPFKEQKNEQESSEKNGGGEKFCP